MPSGDIEVLYRALASPFGLEVAITGSADYFVGRLHRARAKADDPELKCLRFRRSTIDPAGFIWITKDGAATVEIGESNYEQTDEIK